jgi:small conductance mechanosensitive channel
MENVNYLLEKAQEVIAVFGLKIVAAIIILVVGRWIAKALKKVLVKLMEKSKVEPTLVSFVGHLIYFALLTFVILAALGQLGIQTTSFIAVIGAAGLAIGLALQGSLANFAAGVLMLIFRPFKVGDFIEAAGTAGTVEEIQIFTTQLKTPDNKTIIIPNGKITADNITNISTKPTRRVDFVFGVSYGDDIDRVKEVIADVLAQDSRILPEPPPQIALMQLADSSVNFVVRPWVKAGDYWDVFFDINERMKKRFDAEGINIPFPQRDVHLYQTN